MEDPAQDNLIKSKYNQKSHDLSQTNWRYLLLALSGLLCFGSYFVYDNPSPLQPQIEDRLNIDSFDFNLLYSVYSFPNIILPFLGGYLVDAVGVRAAAILFASLICTGQAIFAFGIGVSSFAIAIIGRVIFGLGGESLSVTQGSLISFWFADKELSMALGMSVSISRLGSVLNNILEPQFNNSTGSIDFGIWFGFFLCIFSLLIGFGIVFLDKKRDKRLGIKNKKVGEDFRLSDIKNFKFSFWMISINCLVVYICVFNFNNIASGYFQTRFNWSSAEAGYWISVTFGVAAICCPIFGMLIDKIGRRTVLIFICAVLMIIVHTILVSLPDCDKCAWGGLSLFLLGFGYSIYASVIWASIPYIVESKSVGSGFGVAMSIQNLGLSFGPMIVGKIYDKTTSQHGYMWVSIFFIFMGIIGLITASLLWIYDNKHGGVLSSKNPKTMMINYSENTLGDIVKESEMSIDVARTQ